MTARRHVLALTAAVLLAVSMFLTVAPSAHASARSKAYWALKWAESKTGAWYCFGGTGPCYDCSGLVMSAFNHVGFGLPRTTYAMLASGRIYQVSARSARQGDLVFWGNFHVEIKTLHGTFGAQQTGTRVGWHRIWGAPTYWRIRY